MSDFNLLIYKLGQLDKFDTEIPLNTGICASNKCGDKLSLVCDSFNHTKMLHQGCILSKAAANALLLSVENKNNDQALKIIDQFMDMFDSNDSDVSLLTPDLLLFQKFIDSETRWDCILICARALKSALMDKSFQFL